MDTTFDTFHCPMLLLNDTAVSNIPFIRTTRSVFHNDISPVKNVAVNMEDISIHCEVSHNEISPLNVEAESNVDDMVVTWETSHNRSLSNDVAF